MEKKGTCQGERKRKRTENIEPLLPPSTVSFLISVLCLALMSKVPPFVFSMALKTFQGPEVHFVSSSNHLRQFAPPTPANVRSKEGHLSVLDEANVGALLTEALTADVEAVLTDQTSRVGADAALARALAVGPRARIPDRLVRHVVWVGGG